MTAILKEKKNNKIHIVEFTELPADYIKTVETIIMKKQELNEKYTIEKKFEKPE